MTKKEAKILALSVFANNVDILIESEVVGRTIKTSKDAELVNAAFDEFAESFRKRAERLNKTSK